MGSLTVRSLRTAPRLGRGLIQCREEDTKHNLNTQTIGCQHKLRVQLEHWRKRSSLTSTHITHGTAEGEAAGRWLLAIKRWEEKVPTNVSPGERVKSGVDPFVAQD